MLGYFAVCKDIPDLHATFLFSSVASHRLAVQSTDIPRPMHLRLLPEKGKYKSKRCKKMEQRKAKMDYKVLTEKISPDNVAVMAELIAMRETRALIGYMGYHAEKAHKQLCRDIFGKYQPEYTFSDSYDLVQSVALFLCGHYGEYLDDVLYISKRGKPRTIKIECYLIITRMLARDHRALCKCQCLEFTKEEPEPVYEHQAGEEQDYSHADEIVASLKLMSVHKIVSQQAHAP